MFILFEFKISFKGVSLIGDKGFPLKINDGFDLENSELNVDLMNEINFFVFHIWGISKENDFLLGKRITIVKCKSFSVFIFFFY